MASFSRLKKKCNRLSLVPKEYVFYSLPLAPFLSLSLSLSLSFSFSLDWYGNRQFSKLELGSVAKVGEGGSEFNSIEFSLIALHQICCIGWRRLQLWRNSADSNRKEIHSTQFRADQDVKFHDSLGFFGTLQLVAQNSNWTCEILNHPNETEPTFETNGITTEI